MTALASQISAFLASASTSRLCEMWRVTHDRLLVEPNGVMLMVLVEEELERRFPQQFKDWVGIAEDDFAAYCDPRRFFTISNAAEGRI